GGTMSTNPARAWADRAHELARWAWRFVNRVDVFGRHTNPEDRGKEFTRKDGSVGKVPKTWTGPPPHQRGKVLLTEELLAQHFAARHAGDLIGIHAVGADNLSRWGAVDIDQHGEGGNDPRA